MAGSSREAQQIGKQKKETAERYVLRLRFWETLLKRLKGKTKLHLGITPNKGNWLGTGAGLSGLSYNYIILMNEVRIELYIDTGDAESNHEDLRGASGLQE